ncbi:MAG: hypothetical protein HZA90_28070 [Verrucomicrobia bacterium]|nr:hypothetical protein [Verrucomicrobiota bacterium]
MQRKSTGRQQPSSVKRGVVALFLLICLLGQVEVWPDLLALGAWLEGSHAVRLGRGEATIQLVLCHAGVRAGQADVTRGQGLCPANHRHGMASKLVCVVADRADGLPDHAASFHTAWTCELSRPQVGGGKSPVPNAPSFALAALPALTFSACSPALTSAAHAPPGTPVPVASLRSVSLLL